MMLYKTNHYEIALLLFVKFNNYQYNILLVQVLLLDESVEFYIWIFNKILKVTNRKFKVIITNTDSAVNFAICQIFLHIYSIHYVFNITQNLHKNLRKSLKDDY